MTNFFVAALPEPTTGQSTANKKIYSDLSKIRSITLIDTSPKISKKNINYHAARVISNIYAFIKILSSKNESTIYTVYESGLGIIYNHIIFFGAKIKKSKVILHHHTSEHTINKSTKFKRLIKNRTSMLTHVFLSSSMMEDFNKNYGHGNSIILNNASLINYTPTKPRILTKNIIAIGYISNITVEKGSKNILKLIQSLVSSKISFEFVVAGPISDSDSEHYINLCSQIAGDKFKYIGKVSGKSKEDFFKSIDLLVFPTEYVYEAQPLIILEAISRGIPSITSKMGYTWETVPSNKFYCEDIEDFNLTVLRVISSYEINKDNYYLDSEECINFFTEMLTDSKNQFNELIKKFD